MIKKTFSNWSDIFCKNSEYSEERGLPMSPARTSTGATRGMNLGIFFLHSKCTSEKYCIFIFLFFDFLITIKKIIATKKWKNKKVDHYLNFRFKNLPRQHAF